MDDAPSYDEQRLAWRKGLREDILRSLASDYMRGIRDECTYDAYQEYLIRFGPVSSKHPYAPQLRHAANHAQRA